MLTAVDSAVMVIDAAKGIETQTRKLFEVCRLRDVPIFTFINKMDRDGRDPLELLDEIERDLQLARLPRQLADRHGLRLPRRATTCCRTSCILFERGRRRQADQGACRSTGSTTPSSTEQLPPRHRRQAARGGWRPRRAALCPKFDRSSLSRAGT